MILPPGENDPTERKDLENRPLKGPTSKLHKCQLEPHCSSTCQLLIETKSNSQSHCPLTFELHSLKDLTEHTLHHHQN